MCSARGIRYTSAIMILRNAFAIDASTPTRSNSTDRCDSRFTSTLSVYAIGEIVSGLLVKRNEVDILV